MLRGLRLRGVVVVGCVRWRVVGVQHAVCRGAWGRCCSSTRLLRACAGGSVGMMCDAGHAMGDGEEGVLVALVCFGALQARVGVGRYGAGR